MLSFAAMIAANRIFSCTLIFCLSLVNNFLVAQSRSDSSELVILDTLAADLYLIGPKPKEAHDRSREGVYPDKFMFMGQGVYPNSFKPDVGQLGLIRGSDTLLEPRYITIESWHGLIQAFVGFRFILMDTLGNRIQAEELQMVFRIQDTSLYVVQNDSGQGILNAAGHWILKPNWRKIEHFKGLGYRVKKDNNSGFLNMDLSEKIPCQYWEIRPMSTPSNEVVYIIRNHNAYYGLCDAEGKVCLKTEYEGFDKISFGLLPIRQNRYWGVVDNSCSLIIPCKYMQIHVRKEVVLCYRENMNFDIYNIEGKAVVSDIQYSGNTPYGFGQVRKDSLLGIVAVDRKGTRIYWEPQFLSLKEVMTDTAWNAQYVVTQRNGKYGVLDLLQDRVICEDALDQVVIVKYTKPNGYSVERMRIYGRKGDKWTLIGAPGEKISFTIKELKQHIEANQPAPYVFHSYDTLPAFD